jgi:disulfide bond formation protein DsbB
MAMITFSKNLNLKFIIIFLGGFSFLALIVAYIAQYVFNLQPCILCIYQRWPYFLAAAIMAPSFFVSKKNILAILLAISILAIFGESLLAFYHVMVEYKIFKGFGGCEAKDLSAITNIAELRKAINDQPLVKCSEPQFHFLGLTMAFWNMIYSLILLFFTIYFICYKTRKD